MAARLIPKTGGSPLILDKPILLIGRQPNCDIVIQSSSKVSRRHCCFAQVNGKYLVRDLGSMNGIRVNGSRVMECVLQPGDEVAVGDVCFLFRSENDARTDHRGGDKAKSGRRGEPQVSSSSHGEEPYLIPLPEELDSESGVVHLEDHSGGYLLEPEDHPFRELKDSDSNADAAFRV